MQIFVFIHIYRVDLDSDILKIFSCDLHRFPDICNIRIYPALACQDQNFFHAGMRNNLHLMLDFLHRQLLPADVVITVEATVNAVVLAIVCNIKRCEDIDRISKMILRDLLCFPCHLFQIRCCCRWQQCLKVLDRTALMWQRTFYICRSIGIIVICIHSRKYFVLDIRIDHLHAFHIFHMICPERCILFQTMLAR